MKELRSGSVIYIEDVVDIHFECPCGHREEIGIYATFEVGTVHTCESCGEEFYLSNEEWER